MTGKDRGTDTPDPARGADADLPQPAARVAAAKGDAARGDRLKAALRANLQRRKTQTRARRAPHEPG